MTLKPCAAPSDEAIYSLIHERWIDPWKGVVYSRYGKPIAPEENGYVRISRRGYPSTIYGHRIIWESVFGPVPDGHYIDHKNGLKSDNRISNLEPVLPAENARRAVKKGLAATGERIGTSKLTASQVCEIRRTTRTVSGKEWARRLGVDATTVTAARRRKTWRHIVCHRDGTASPRASGRLSTRRRPRRRSVKGGESE
ncbi:HNH endonuclease signature motif containing protein [Lysobacter firmicutimachus]|uniref:HNH endonuclease signature motif containing protein n=1 Tax=Lysobacter firmicutimachus TaxID=1792846 RepID=A0AAU8MT87_9GAMM